MSLYLRYRAVLKKKKSKNLILEKISKNRIGTRVQKSVLQFNIIGFTAKIGVKNLVILRLSSEKNNTVFCW